MDVTAPCPLLQHVRPVNSATRLLCGLLRLTPQICGQDHAAARPISMRAKRDSTGL